MGLSLDEVGTDTDQIYITAVRFEIEHITTKGEQFGSVLINLVLVDSHFIFGDLYAPLLNNVTHKFHRLVL